MKLENGKLASELISQDLKDHGFSRVEKADLVRDLFDVRERIYRALGEDVALPLEIQADRHELVAGRPLEWT